MPRQRPPLPAGIAAQFFICGFIGFLGKLTISEHGGHGTQFGKAFGLHTIDMCAAIKLSFVASKGRESGRKGGRRCQSSAKAQYHECLARHVCVCVCVSLSFSLWIRIQIEVTNLNWPQKWLPLFLPLPRPCPLWRRLAKSNRKQGFATCLCTQCPPLSLPPHLCRFQCCPLHTVCASYIMQHWSQANSLSTPRSEAVAGTGGAGEVVILLKVSAKTHNAPS